MVWRITEIYKTGSVAEDATPYATIEDALAIIKAHWDRGLIDKASVQDHDYNQIKWAEIKKRLAIS